MVFLENAASQSSQAHAGKFEPSSGDKHGIDGFLQIAECICVTTNVRVVPRPFRENRVRIESAPNLPHLKPAEDYVRIFPIRVEPEPPTGLLNGPKPTEEQK